MNPSSSTRLTRPSEVKSLLAELDFHPSRVLGQNFLIDANILDIIVEAAGPSSAEHILEVGPGLGVLTERLLERAGQVTAVEKDHRLCAWLRKRFAGTTNLNLIEGDILEQNLPGLVASGAGHLVANLPYCVASRLLVELFLGEPRPRRMVITLQKEVTDRLAAQPATDDYGLLSILTQLCCRIVQRKNISRTCFYPSPDIASSMVVLETRTDIPEGSVLRTTFRFAKDCFHHRRKQMATLIKHQPVDRQPRLHENLERLGYRPETRPEEIPPADWPKLVREEAS